MRTTRSPSPDAPSTGAAIPDFTPVPLRHRIDGWTPERQRSYVALLRKSGLAVQAARAVGMTPQSAARLRRRPEGASFDAACAAALASARLRWKALHLLEARRRRRDGRFTKFLNSELRSS